MIAENSVINTLIIISIITISYKNISFLTLLYYYVIAQQGWRHLGGPKEG